VLGVLRVLVRGVLVPGVRRVLGVLRVLVLRVLVLRVLVLGLLVLGVLALGVFGVFGVRWVRGLLEPGDGLSTTARSPASGFTM
jgi:hypothetical protein